MASDLLTLPNSDIERLTYDLFSRNGLLIAAKGSSIEILSLRTGLPLSTWTCPATAQLDLQPAAPTQPQKEDAEIEVDRASSPAKRRKLTLGTSINSNGSNDQSKNEVKKKNNRKDAVASGLEAPAVIALAVTRKGFHVVAVTGEDKAIRYVSILLF